MTFSSLIVFGQQEILFNNPSFEGMPHTGGREGGGINGWYDCGILMFDGETPPDLHPINNLFAINDWGVRKDPQDGYTYLGMVIRDNDTWESVSQRLSGTLYSSSCYEFTAQIAKSEVYLSGSKELLNKFNSEEKVQYTEPAVLRIWGGTGVCGRQELLAESKPVDNTDWAEYTFRLEPSRNYNYITLEAFYETPVLLPYNGHILLDNLSSITEVPCDDQLVVEEKKVEIRTPQPPKTQNKPRKTPRQVVTSSSIYTPPSIVQTEPKVRKPQSVSGLGIDKIKEGQTIRIKNLSFKMNDSTILEESYLDLDLVYKFLMKNRSVIVELGGHTNTIPSKDFCLRLSKARAKAVADYLIEKGINERQIKYKGYGKTKPLVDDRNNNMKARMKNQRVEIKILEIG